MSTKNPGGNRKGGTDAMPGDPFGYMKMGPNHGYLGHFKAEKFMREGHNTTPYRKIVDPGPAPRRIVDPGPVRPPVQPHAPVIDTGRSTSFGAPRRIVDPGPPVGKPTLERRGFRGPKRKAPQKTILMRGRRVPV